MWMNKYVRINKGKQIHFYVFSNGYISWKRSFKQTWYVLVNNVATKKSVLKCKTDQDLNILTFAEHC